MLEYKPVNLRARRLAIEAYKLQDLLHIQRLLVETLHFRPPAFGRLFLFFYGRAALAALQAAIRFAAAPISACGLNTSPLFDELLPNRDDLCEFLPYFLFCTRIFC